MALNRLKVKLPLYVAFAVLMGSTSLHALTLQEALVNAYRHNPDINQQRAALRVIDETVPAALSGYRPSLNATASAGVNKSEAITFGGAQFTTKQAPRSVGGTISQPLFDGMRTKNNVNSAESNVKLAREDLRAKEQNIFLSIVVAYMNVLRDEAILKLREQALGVAERDLRSLKDRFKFGDASRTDVGLTEAQQGLAQLNLAVARTDLSTSKSIFLQHTGLKAEKMAKPKEIYNSLPKKLEEAVAQATSNHPAVKGALYGADAAQFQVYVAEAALYPQLTLNASGSRGNEISSTAAKLTTGSASVNLIIPIFANGGRDYTSIRSAKESLGQRQIQIDLARASAKQAAMASHGLVSQAKFVIESSNLEIKGRETVVKGLREEYKVGQKVLQAVLVEEVNLTNAQVTVVRNENIRIVAAYSLLASMGKLNANSLKLNVQTYNTTEHYDAVRDNWLGLRTPDGR